MFVISKHQFQIHTKSGSGPEHISMQLMHIHEIFTVATFLLVPEMGHTTKKMFPEMGHTAKQNVSFYHSNRLPTYKKIWTMVALKLAQNTAVHQ
jgi:hypothetical protein